MRWCFLLAAMASGAWCAGAMSGLFFGETVYSTDQRAFAMGGAGLGVPGGAADPMNPASLTRSRMAFRSLTYRPWVNWAEDDQASQRLTSGRLGAGVMSLPVGRGVVLGASFEQLHSAQYRYSQACTTSWGTAYTWRVLVSGGVYGGGLSVASHLSSGFTVGVGWRWLFGAVNRVYEVDYAPTSWEDTKDALIQRHGGGFPVVGVRWERGVVGAGFYWSGRSRGKGSLVLRNKAGVERESPFAFALAPRVGFGVGVGPVKGFSLAGDVWREDWSRAHYQGSHHAFRPVTWWGVGVEYQATRKTIPPVRVGFRSRRLYYLLPTPEGGLSSEPPTDRAFTFGTMVTDREGRGSLQVGLAVGRRGSGARFGLRERYLEISLGVAGLEPWERRRVPAT